MTFAIILSGCGNRDGSELQETLSLMLAIDRRGHTYQCFAPQGSYTVVSHLDGTTDDPQRDLLTESARIARGKILPLSQYRANDFDALALPGGMGAARNLSTYAFQGPDMQVRPDVERAILDTYRIHKPILAMCIAPIVLAKVLGSQGIVITFGQPCDAANVAQQLGARHQCCPPEQACVDPVHRIYTTPAYMVASRISQIFQGADSLLEALCHDLKR